MAILTFTDGRKLVYKPRSLGVEVHFNQLVDWLNTNGLRHQLRPLRVLDRGEYGWVEHVAVAPCQDEEQVDRFFWRQGSYLALFYALCGSDMHLENVIASGEHPVLVDLEAIFQVRPRVDVEEALPLVLGEAPRVVRDSVLRVGLLPERMITADESGVYDAEVSGLAGVAASSRRDGCPPTSIVAPTTYGSCGSGARCRRRRTGRGSTVDRSTHWPTSRRSPPASRSATGSSRPTGTSCSPTTA
ncbi:hypothetical protein GCM10027614_82680 [Micromonospora vulcania]